MNIKRKYFSNSLHMLIVAFAIVPLIACAEMYKKTGDADPADHGNKISDFEFSVATNPDGTLRPVVRGQNGAELPGQRIPRGQSVAATSIEEMETITVLRAKGSHYFVVMIAGRSYKFDLPH